MSEQPTDDVMGSLPRTRPHRRSAKRGPAAEPAPTTDNQPAASVPSTRQRPATATAKARASVTPTAKAKAKPTTPRKAKPSTPRKANPTAPRKAKPTTPRKAKAPAKPSGAGGSARSLQSATAPRAAGDRSRKPGVTSQAHHRTDARPDRPPSPRRSAPPAAEPAGPMGTAVQAAAELTEIGLKASARALRGALSRLPRP